MYRMTKEELELALIGLVFIRDRGRTIDDLTRNILSENWSRHNPELNMFHKDEGHYNAVVGAGNSIHSVKKYNPDMITMDSTIDNLTKRLNSASANRDSDILDLVVDAIKAPFGKNILSGKTLGKLRAAILIPSEVSALKTSLQAKELHCSSCGKGFIHDELGSVFIEQGDVHIRCSKCRVPMYTACPKCDGSARLSVRVHKVIEKQEPCDACMTKLTGVKIKEREQERPEIIEPRFVGEGQPIHLGERPEMVDNGPMPVPADTPIFTPNPPNYRQRVTRVMAGPEQDQLRGGLRGGRVLTREQAREEERRIHGDLHTPPLEDNPFEPRGR